MPAPAAARNGIATPSEKSAPPTSDPTAVAVLSAVPTMPCASALRPATASIRNEFMDGVVNAHSAPSKRPTNRIVGMLVRFG